ncbi:MAG: hypothetical protein LBQ68_01685 [Clostridiales bacterium]|jgi:methyl-accepting chemotaxis protein|nr:hypothetical protein [Clostridiales bacterium]
MIEVKKVGENLLEELFKSIENLQSACADANNRMTAFASLIETARDLSNRQSELSDFFSVISGLKKSLTNMTQLNKLLGDTAFLANMLALSAADLSAKNDNAENSGGYKTLAKDAGNLAKRNNSAARITDVLISDLKTHIYTGLESAQNAEDTLKQINISAGQLLSLIEQIQKIAHSQAESQARLSDWIGQVKEIITAYANEVKRDKLSEHYANQAQSVKQLANPFTPISENKNIKNKSESNAVIPLPRAKLAEPIQHLETNAYIIDFDLKRKAVSELAKRAALKEVEKQTDN